MSKSEIRILLTVGAIAAISCGGGQASDSSPAPTAAPAKSSVSDRMHENFAIIDEMRKAVVRGELREAQRQAKELGGRLKNSDYPDDWKEHLQKVRSAVWAANGASDLATFASYTARAGRACGDCHVALELDILSGPIEPAKGADEPMADFMVRHRWAAERLWDGLVGPAEQSWKLGAEELAKVAPLATESMPVAMKSLAHQLGEIAERTRVVAERGERTETVGLFLSACASCHRAYLDEVD